MIPKGQEATFESEFIFFVVLTKPVPDELSISSSSLCRNSNKECAAIRSSEIPDIVLLHHYQLVLLLLFLNLQY